MNKPTALSTRATTRRCAAAAPPLTKRAEPSRRHLSSACVALTSTPRASQRGRASVWASETISPDAIACIKPSRAGDAGVALSARADIAEAYSGTGDKRAPDCSSSTANSTTPSPKPSCSSGTTTACQPSVLVICCHKGRSRPAGSAAAARATAVEECSCRKRSALSCSIRCSSVKRNFTAHSCHKASTASGAPDLLRRLFLLQQSRHDRPHLLRFPARLLFNPFCTAPAIRQRYTPALGLNNFARHMSARFRA